MIAYVDTSAVVPLLVVEAATPACQKVWQAAETFVSSRLLYVEVAAALARARRSGRLTDRGHRACIDQLQDMWGAFRVVNVEQRVIERAATLASEFQLRGYDAVHCASAEFANEAELVAVAGDRRLLEAWQRLGIDTVDVNA